MSVTKVSQLPDQLIKETDQTDEKQVVVNFKIVT